MDKRQRSVVHRPSAVSAICCDNNSNDDDDDDNDIIIIIIIITLSRGFAKARFPLPELTARNNGPS